MYDECMNVDYLSDGFKDDIIALFGAGKWIRAFRNPHLTYDWTVR